MISGLLRQKSTDYCLASPGKVLSPVCFPSWARQGQDSAGTLQQTASCGLLWQLDPEPGTAGSCVPEEPSGKCRVFRDPAGEFTECHLCYVPLVQALLPLAGALGQRDQTPPLGVEEVKSHCVRAGQAHTCLSGPLWTRLHLWSPRLTTVVVCFLGLIKATVLPNAAT